MITSSQSPSPLTVPIQIGTVPFSSRIILAPMDGYSDAPFRLLTRRLGSGASFTEFINTIEVMSRNTKYQERCVFSEEEKPVAIQIFDDNVNRLIAGAARIYEKFKPDMIDVNMGCSVNHVSSRGAGAGLLRHPDKIEAIIAGLVKALPCPVSAKIRLGWDSESINFLTIGKIIQDQGAAMVTLHARTREQLFKGTVDWNAIRNLKAALTIPVFGNGDLLSYRDAERMIAETNCDGVMIGRAAMENPWIFSGYDPSTVPFALFYSTVIEHYTLVKDRYEPARACVVFRKFAKKYLTLLGAPRGEIYQLLTTKDPEAFETKLTELASVDYRNRLLLAE